MSQSPQPWLDKSLSADERAAHLVAAMTLDEMISLVHGPMPMIMREKPPGALGAAGFVPGVERLGIPCLNQTDASLGIANLRVKAPGDGSTGLPSGLALASSFDSALSRAAGAMVGAEARAMGFNVLLGGGANLTREPRCGRNFEYLGEDPLLTGILAGEAIAGAQSNKIVCTLKHFALNDQETSRHTVDALIAEGPFRESDLLAFQIAIERGDPGSVMCAYNKVNGDWAGENAFLMNQVLKGDWGYKGWVMSDWGAVHSTAKAVNAGLDQECGEQLDSEVFFGEPLKAAVLAGDVAPARVADMVQRILRSLIVTGVFDHPPAPHTPDVAAHARIAQTAAEAGCVLLKNDGVLPLDRRLRKIAIIGGHADIGVLSGGGSSQVIPFGGPALAIRVGEIGGFPRRIIYHPSSPLEALRAAAPQTQFTFDPGTDPHAAADTARQADLAIVFAVQWASEFEDLTTLSLPDDQDALIEAVSAAAQKTVVVVQSGSPILMPWLDQVSAVLEAWYPGSKGGEAIAAVLTGEVNPRGRLPISFPHSVDQLVRPQIPGLILGPPIEGETLPTLNPDVQHLKACFPVDHIEGAAVGYRWYARQGSRPLFAFGHGLSYSAFDHADLAVTGGQTVTATFTTTNTGKRAGVDTPQLYLITKDQDGRPVQRLIGWQTVPLGPGETCSVTLTADPRLLANFDAQAQLWKIPPGPVGVAVGASAVDLTLHAEAVLVASSLAP